MTADTKRILVAQGLRALVYGFASVLLGASLAERGWSASQVGAFLGAVVAGSALASVAVGTFGDRVGRRRFYGGLFAGLALAGVALAAADSFWLLVVIGLTGTLSTEVVESGPFTSLEQAMLPSGLDSTERIRVFGRYNAIATLAGSAGALAAGGPALLGKVLPVLPTDRALFLVLVPVGVAGVVVSQRLSGRVEAHPGGGGLARPATRRPLSRSVRIVAQLSGLFALDSFGGGFVVQSFIVYWFRVRFDTSIEVLGALFFCVGLLQAASFMVATRLAGRIGLLNTMVFTHLPSNLLLAAIPLASSFPGAVALLLARFALSQMDVPTRQAYVIALIDPDERTAAAAYTNTARYLTRPIGPVVAGLSQQVALGLPFLLAGGIKSVYDVVLWLWFRKVPLAEPSVAEGAGPGAEQPSTSRRSGQHE